MSTTDSRWIALIVLCTGMLMIILDSAIVNVALPPIQRTSASRSPTSTWVVNAYLIPFGGLLLLAGRLGDLVGRRTIFLVGLAVFTAGFARLRTRSEPGGPRRRAPRAGRGRRAHVQRHPRDHRHDVPGAGRAGEGDRSVLLRRLGWRLDRAARGRRAHAGHRLALDLLREHADRRRDRAAGAALRGARRGCRPPRGRRRGRRRAGHRRPDARRLHDPRRPPSTAGAPRARSVWARSRSRCSRLHRPRVAHGEPARAAAHLPVASDRGRKCRAVLTVAGLFGMFFLGVLYLQRVLGYDALETGSRSCRSAC